MANVPPASVKHKSEADPAEDSSLLSTYETAALVLALYFGEPIGNGSKPVIGYLYEDDLVEAFVSYDPVACGEDRVGERKRLSLKVGPGYEELFVHRIGAEPRFKPTPLVTGHLEKVLGDLPGEVGARA